MQMRPMGRTGIKLSELCLGTMTFGNRTSETDAHAQIDMSLAAGINCIDAAELYPTYPISAETYGDTEAYIGTWNAKNQHRRGDYILATKHAGDGVKHIRDGAPITAASIAVAVENSLKRLGTDYIDLYQLHWPNRGSYMFRKNWLYDASLQPPKAEVTDNLLECLEALQKQVDKGAIRHIGLSNESAWGVMQYLHLAGAHNLPRIATIQNEYSLLCRLYDTDLAEVSQHEDVGLLSFSPLGTGMLTGKYRNGAVPAGSRKTIVNDLSGRQTERVEATVEAYLQIADDFGLDPVHMALAFCRTRPFMCSSIFGATELPQLERILGSVDVDLSVECLDAIDKTHRAHPMPY